VALVLSMLDPIVALDTQVQRWVQARRTPALEGVMETATDLGRRDLVTGALLGIAVFTGPAGPATARCALAALVASNLVVEGLKRAVNRTRPDGDRKRSNSSFPSGHAASATAAAVVLSARWRRGSWAFVICAGLVSASRIYLNRHFLSDVLFSVVVGVGFGALALRLIPPGGRPEGGKAPA
jgi:undecaprenyl-diphosphatase